MGDRHARSWVAIACTVAMAIGTVAVFANTLQWKPVQQSIRSDPSTTSAVHFANSVVTPDTAQVTQRFAAPSKSQELIAQQSGILSNPCPSHCNCTGDVTARETTSGSDLIVAPHQLNCTAHVDTAVTAAKAAAAKSAKRAIESAVKTTKQASEQQCSSLREGDAKSRATAAPDRMIVVSRSAGDISWLPVFLGSVPTTIMQLVNITQHRTGCWEGRRDKWALCVDNVAHTIGREAAAYMQYIVNNYDNLPASMVFLHEHEESWHRYRPMLRLLQDLKWGNIGYGSLRHWNYRDWWCDDPEASFGWRPCSELGLLTTPSVPSKANNRTLNQAHLCEWGEKGGKAVLEWWPVFFQEEMGDAPEYLHMPNCCGEFMVTRERVLARPLKFYKNALNVMEAGTLEESWDMGLCFELMWHVIFGEPYVAHAVAKCDLYKCTDEELKDSSLVPPPVTHPFKPPQLTGYAKMMLARTYGDDDGTLEESPTAEPSPSEQSAPTSDVSQTNPSDTNAAQRVKGGTAAKSSSALEGSQAEHKAQQDSTDTRNDGVSGTDSATRSNSSKDDSSEGVNHSEKPPGSAGTMVGTEGDSESGVAIQGDTSALLSADSSQQTAHDQANIKARSGATDQGEAGTAPKGIRHDTKKRKAGSRKKPVRRQRSRAASKSAQKAAPSVSSSNQSKNSTAA